MTGCPGCGWSLGVNRQVNPVVRWQDRDGSAAECPLSELTSALPAVSADEATAALEAAVPITVRGPARFLERALRRARHRLHLPAVRALGIINRHGISARPARNGALAALAADLPAAVLADFLGIHVNTAGRPLGHLLTPGLDRLPRCPRHRP
jgi:hypothetical protein